jgi:predicted DCC family thiol-disulfide oxidoreductase YuxK
MIPIDMARDATGSAGASPSPDPEPWTVLYDSDCGFCKWLLAGVLDWDRRELLRPVALQTPEANALLAELTPEQRLASWHLIAPNGERGSAGEVLPPLLRLLPGGALPAAVLARVPALTDPGYRWVAGHRSLLSRWVPSRWKRHAAGRVTRREQRFTVP